MRTKKKILVVEDDKFVRNIVIKFLSKYYDMHGAEDGKVGAGLCGEQESNGVHFDLILCDQSMPIMTGLEMYEALDDTHKERFILWSGDVELASPSGRKMVKGLSAEEIFEAVKTAIYQTRRRPQLAAWTDYPLKPLGDEGGKTAPVRRVTVLTYDKNKYCTVEFTDSGGKNHLFNFKRGYLYKKKGRLEEVESWSHDECCNLPTSLDEKFESEIHSV